MFMQLRKITHWPEQPSKTVSVLTNALSYFHVSRILSSCMSKRKVELLAFSRPKGKV